MKENIAWRQFEAGRDYNRRIGLYENAAVNERFYRGDQWYQVKSGPLPTPIFSLIKRIADYLISQVASGGLSIVYTDEGLPYLNDELTKERILSSIALLNRNSSFRFEACHVERLVRQILLDSVITGDGVLFTYWDPSIKTGQAYTGDFVTVPFDTTNLFVANVNSTDLQSQEYIILSGRESVTALRREARDNGASPDEASHIVPDGDLHYGAGDCAAFENLDPSSEKATFIIKFYKNSEGKVCFEKYTKECHIKTVATGLSLYPVCMFNWTPTKNSYHGTSPVTQLIGNQKYVNKAYALMMKHMIDTAFSKVIYDKTRIPEWTNEVGETIGVVGGNLDGIVTTVRPGEMDPSFAGIINSVIETTKETMGATETSLGEVTPNNTSAILALQEANALGLDSVRVALHTCLEELAAIWLDFMCAYYADGRMILSDRGAEVLDLRSLRGQLIRSKVEVNQVGRYSSTASLSVLNQLLSGGYITPKQYVERLPEGILPGRESLLCEWNQQEESEKVTETEEPTDE